MNLKKTAVMVASAGATFVTASFFALKVSASGYYTTYSSTADTAAGIFGLSWGILACCTCIPLILFVVLAYVVYKDAVKYKVENPILWALLTFFTGLIGLLVYYLAIRPDAIKKMEAGGTSSTPSTDSPITK